ncbi:MAG: hypothetical protein ACR2KN_09035 [Geodermatophilaceae bacterium]
MAEPGSPEDELRGRMHALARQVQQQPGGGLADVRRRRVRRQRTTAAGTGLAVVAVLGAVALVLPAVGEDASVRPIAPAPSVTLTQPGTPSAPATTVPDPTAPTTTPPTSGAPQGTGSTSTSTTPPTLTEGSYALDLGSLVTPDELRRFGVPTTSTAIGDGGSQPTIPGLCTGPTWQEQYSSPRDRVAGSYQLDGGQLLADLLAYSDGVQANAALVKLKEDARACPTVNEFLQITVTAVGSAIGDEFVVFALDSESGLDGSKERIWVTIARIGNVLAEATLDRDPGYTGDISADQQLSRDAAQAGVDHLLAS